MKVTFQNGDIKKSKKINQIILEDLRRRYKNELFPLSLTSHIQKQTSPNYIFPYAFIGHNWTYTESRCVIKKKTKKNPQEKQQTTYWEILLFIFFEQPKKSTPPTLECLNPQHS